MVFDFFQMAPALPQLMGPSLYLRPPRKADWQDWARLRAESRGHLTPWEPVWPEDTLTKASFARRIQRYQADRDNDRGYSFFLFENGTDRIVGGLNISNIRRGVAQSCTFGYWIGKSETGKGFMTEAVVLAAGYAFDSLGLHRVEAACLPHNTPSRRVLEKAGFREEGYARRYLKIAGRWQDHVLYGLLREDLIPPAPIGPDEMG